MISKVTDCPHLDPDHLSEIAETAAAPHRSEMEQIIAHLKAIAPDVAVSVNRLDDLYLAVINAVQNATVLNIVCNKCDTLQECHS
jgi:hypothetical protein